MRAVNTQMVHAPLSAEEPLQDGENGGIGLLLLHRLAHMQQQRQRSGIAGFAGFGEAETIGFADVGGAADEDLPLTLAFGDEHAAEADVSYDDAAGAVV